MNPSHKEFCNNARQLENINLSRTLNFVFRQMNQAFISFVHLTDVRIGYFDGRRESRIEVPVSALDSLLDRVVKPAAIGRCCIDRLRFGTRPTRDGFQATRSKLGRQNSVIRFKIRTPI